MFMFMCPKNKSHAEYITVRLWAKGVKKFFFYYRRSFNTLILSQTKAYYFLFFFCFVILDIFRQTCNRSFSNNKTTFLGIIYLQCGKATLEKTFSPLWLNVRSFQSKQWPDPTRSGQRKDKSARILSQHILLHKRQGERESLTVPESMEITDKDQFYRATVQESREPRELLTYNRHRDTKEQNQQYL